ncbi:MAG: cobalamin-dependent protein [Thermodesulfobacteriota bacterium]
MKVLLINTNTKKDLLAAPPLGLCYVAEATENAGHEVQVLDLCFSKHLERDIKQSVARFSPDAIGLSVRNIDNVNMLNQVLYVPEAIEIARHIRSVTTVPLVVGGSGASLIPEQILKHLAADYVVVSDGEESFPRLLASLQEGRPPDVVPGVGMMREGRFHLTPPQMGRFTWGNPDLGRWLDMRGYQSIGGSYNLQTKRGCAQNCIYCTYNQALEGNKLRLRSPKDVVDEVEEAVLKYRPHTFEFVDSVFNDPLEHSVRILEEIIRRPWKAHFTAMGVSSKNLDSPYLDLMWRAGFRSFMITPESASSEMLKNYQKGFTQDDVMRAAEAIGRSEFAAWWFFMIGGPGETNETLQESLDFALNHLQKKGRRVTNVAHFFSGVRIYPRTVLWDIAVRDGLISADADPLQPLWYISPALDLDLAVEQMIDAARRAPEVYLGFDERILIFSKAAALFFEFFRFRRPYWRYFRAANAFGLKSGIRFMFKPPDVAAVFRQALARQGSPQAILRKRIATEAHPRVEASRATGEIR